MIHFHCVPVGDAPVVFAPCHLVGVGLQQMPADPVVNTELGAAQPGKVALRLIGTATILAFELDRMIDPLHRIGRMQDVPSTRSAPR
jgi:hypothetical protein